MAHGENSPPRESPLALVVSFGWAKPRSTAVEISSPGVGTQENKRNHQRLKRKSSPLRSARTVAPPAAQGVEHLASGVPRGPFATRPRRPHSQGSAARAALPPRSPFPSFPNSWRTAEPSCPNPPTPPPPPVLSFAGPFPAKRARVGPGTGCQGRAPGAAAVPGRGRRGPGARLGPAATPRPAAAAPPGDPGDRAVCRHGRPGSLGLDSGSTRLDVRTVA